MKKASIIFFVFHASFLFSQTGASVKHELDSIYNNLKVSKTQIYLNQHQTAAIYTTLNKNHLDTLEALFLPFDKRLIKAIKKEEQIYENSIKILGENEFEEALNQIILDQNLNIDQTKTLLEQAKAQADATAGQKDTWQRIENELKFAYKAENNAIQYLYSYDFDQAIEFEKEAIEHLKNALNQLPQKDQGQKQKNKEQNSQDQNNTEQNKQDQTQQQNEQAQDEKKREQNKVQNDQELVSSEKAKQLLKQLQEKNNKQKEENYKRFLLQRPQPKRYINQDY